MWQEHAPKTEEITKQAQLSAADDKLESLSKDAKQKAWQHDSLSLARDVAAIAKMYQQVQKDTNAERIRRVAHVRSENMIGASIINNHMEQHAKHMAGSENDLINAAEQADKMLNHFLFGFSFDLMCNCMVLFKKIMPKKV